MKQARAGLVRRWRRRGGAWWWGIVVIVVPVAVIAAAAVSVLLTFVDTGDPKNQIELIKTGLTVGAGTGGVVALVLTGRRQWATEHDAGERRLTELYVKAVEQLGSEKAAVRQGGLYALERVAQGNPDQRQTVVNVLCAYLRAPFPVPGTLPSGRSRGIRRPAPEGAPRVVSDEWSAQEREVRRTAQRILGFHLRPGTSDRHPADTFWADIDLDLTGAVLIDFDFGQCRANRTRFDEAKFAGDATFRQAEFTGNTRFPGARFAGKAWFGGARFGEEAIFEGATFSDDAVFGDITAAALMTFEGATFAGEAWFRSAKFAGKAWFREAKFAKGVPAEAGTPSDAP
ncbi:pentapeptide repeat-containing protein [Amycolatopsis sp. CA-128772]|uniref:pentapeptide repeat-containing protein n=1 Tax=Amycolatopsis sp. CA-128772 TaxID=2073159 RepID=UPI000CD2FAF8|nr:pentapeptide repeat-containing protein [Amycolatopsis sp. CA-128772]